MKLNRQISELLQSKLTRLDYIQVASTYNINFYELRSIVKRERDIDNIQPINELIKRVYIQ